MSAEAKLAAGEQRMDDIERRLGNIEGDLKTVVESMAKQRGFIAGVSVAFSLLATTIVGLVVYIWNAVR